MLLMFSLITDERRGVGGIFFDDLEIGPQEDLFKFVTVNSYISYNCIQVCKINSYIFLFKSVDSYI